jgi:hypothetical protein
LGLVSGVLLKGWDRKVFPFCISAGNEAAKPFAIIVPVQYFADAMTNWFRKNRVSLLGLLTVLLLFLVNRLLPNDPPGQYHPWTKLSGFLQYFLLVFLFMRWSLRGKRIILFNLGLFAGLIAAVELTFFFIMGMPQPLPRKFKLPDLKPDHIASHLGNVPNANKVMERHKVVKGDTVFKVGYTIDEYCRRSTPGFDSSRSQYAMFFGCSVGFGYGLEDNQTLSYHFQENMDMNAYNYCYMGWGTNHMLARLQHKNLSEEVREKDGVAIYVFIGAHFRRNIGDMNIYNLWGYRMPHYRYDGDGNVVRDGNFQTGRPILNRIYAELYRSSFFRYFDINLPFSLSRRHLELTSDIIVQSRREYEAQFGNDRFFVLLHPMSWIGFDQEDIDEFKEILKEKNLPYFDYTDYELSQSRRLVGDAHPNETTYMEVARRLSKEDELINGR